MEWIALLIVGSIALTVWYAQHISPLEYVSRAHVAEQRVVELEAEVDRLQTEMSRLEDKFFRQMERSAYYE